MQHLVGLSKRAQNALKRLGNPSKEDIRNMHTRKLSYTRGVGIKTVQEICAWAGRDAPCRCGGPAPSEKRKPLTLEQRQARHHVWWLRSRGYTVIEPNACITVPIARAVSRRG